MIQRFALLATVAPGAFENARAAITPADVLQAKAAQTGNSLSADPMLKRGRDSAHMLSYWDKADAVIEGIDGIRLGGEQFLPRFVEEDSTEYEFRLKMTKMTNVFRDIIEDLSSKPFAEETKLETDDNNNTPQELLDFCENVDGAGNNLTIFANATFFNGIANAIDWIFIDFPKRDKTIKTVAEAKAAGLRPNWSHVLGRNILDAKSETINGNETLTYVKILEPGEPDHVREFIREPGGTVNWKLWEKSNKTGPDGKTQFIVIDEGNISIGVIPMVPFATGRRNGKRFCWLPALRDAADLQVELYQMESGLKFVKTLTAYPMLAANGIKPIMEADGKTPKRVRTGPSRVLYSPPDGNGNSGTWQYLEPSAQSLTFLASDIKDTIAQLRELGRQPLTAQSGNLTVITTAVAANKSNSAVKQWALMLKDALENAFVITCKWLAIDTVTYDPTVSVFTEFDDWTDNGDLASIDADRDRGDISRITLWEEKKRRGVYGPEFDEETETERLLAEVPSDGADTQIP